MQRTTMSDGLAVLHIGWLHVIRLHVIIVEEKNLAVKKEGAD